MIAVQFRQCEVGFEQHQALHEPQHQRIGRVRILHAQQIFPKAFIGVESTDQILGKPLVRRTVQLAKTGLGQKFHGAVDGGEGLFRTVAAEFAFSQGEHVGAAFDRELGRRAQAIQSAAGFGQVVEACGGAQGVGVDQSVPFGQRRRRRGGEGKEGSRQGGEPGGGGVVAMLQKDKGGTDTLFGQQPSCIDRLQAFRSRFDDTVGTFAGNKGDPSHTLVQAGKGRGGRHLLGAGRGIDGQLALPGVLLQVPQQQTELAAAGEEVVGIGEFGGNGYDDVLPLAAHLLDDQFRRADGIGAAAGNQAHDAGWRGLENAVDEPLGQVAMPAGRAGADGEQKTWNDGFGCHGGKVPRFMVGLGNADIRGYPRKGRDRRTIVCRLDMRADAP